MERLFKSGLITTILGCAIIIGAVVLYYMKRPMEEITIMVGWGMTFLRSKDSLIGIAPKK